MQSVDLIRLNLTQSLERVLMRVEDMREHAVVFPTPNGGAHTLWVLGHIAFIESQVVHQFLRGGTNPLASWEPVFDGADVSGALDDFPPFDDVLAKCREVRAETIALLDTLAEADLDKSAGMIPKGWDHTFGTYRQCLQFVADHTYMHRGQLADARRAAGLTRMWV